MSIRRFQWAAEGERCSLAAKLSQLGSSSRGRRYLRALAGLFPEPPNTTEAFSRARSPSCPLTLQSPKRQQILIGFAGHVSWRCEPTNPSPINVGHSQPRQPLSNTGVKVWFVQRLLQDLRGVSSSPASKIGESWIPERTQFGAEIALVRRH